MIIEEIIYATTLQEMWKTLEQSCKYCSRDGSGVCRYLFQPRKICAGSKTEWIWFYVCYAWKKSGNYPYVLLDRQG